MLCADATAQIIVAMQTARVTRLICCGCALFGELPETLSPLLHLRAQAFAAIHPAIAADRAFQEDTVRSSRLQWTLVKPCRLKSGPVEGKPRAGTALRLGLFSSVSRESVAGFMLDELQRPRFLRKVVYLGSG